jgi:hypothetical protein
MKERDRPISSNELLGPGGLGNPFGLAGDDNGGTVTVDYGVYREDLPLGGRTVGEIRRTVGPRYDIGPQAVATIDGRPAGEDVLVRPGQKLRFMNLAGEKGKSG